jgi:hypothetical protein
MMKHKYHCEGYFSFDQTADTPAELTQAVKRAIKREGLEGVNLEIKVERYTKQDSLPNVPEINPDEAELLGISLPKTTKHKDKAMLKKSKGRRGLTPRVILKVKSKLPTASADGSVAVAGIKTKKK